MELKKSDKANLDKKRGLFFEVGLVIALGFALLAFEWRVTPKEEAKAEGPVAPPIEEEIIPITRQDEPPPPPPEPPRVTDILDIVDNETIVDTQIDINIEVDLTTEITPVEFTETVIEEVDEVVLFAIVEEKPTFNGEDAEVGFRKWVYDQIVYPAVAQENGITGRVYVQFTIDQTGQVTDVKLLRGVDPSLDAEALRVIRMSPKWTPGKQRDKPVKVSYQFPFNFQLSN